MKASTRPTILAADDDRVTQHALAHAIEACGWKAQVVATGDEALAALEAPGAPLIAILDWIMPGLAGVDDVHGACARRSASVQPYFIMGTVRDKTSEVVGGPRRGRGRLRRSSRSTPTNCRRACASGCGSVALQQALSARVNELQETLSQVARAARPAADVLLLQAHPRRQELPGRRSWSKYLTLPHARVVLARLLPGVHQGAHRAWSSKQWRQAAADNDRTGRSITRARDGGGFRTWCLKPRRFISAICLTRH